MNRPQARFIEPLDVLILRGNKLFGDPGSYGEALIPPWPSVAAGAIRSRMLADAGADMRDYNTWPKELGTPEHPGSFTLAAFYLGRRKDDGGIEVLMPPPGDLSVVEDSAGLPSARLATPTRLAGGLSHSNPLPLHPVLAETTRGKPAGGYWLTESGWARYLQGGLPRVDELVKSGQLWTMDERVGVGLSVERRCVDEGKLFSTQAIAFHPGVGFIAIVTGSKPPDNGLLRFGGDGRGAAITAIVDYIPPMVDYAAISQAGRCRLILTSPGLFAQGWLPHGIARAADGTQRLDLHGVRGRLMCAAVPRAEVISGWDLAQWRPKPAQRGAPTGSVYWLDEISATPEALRKFANTGLWSDSCEDTPRRAEGFNRLALAVW